MWHFRLPFYLTVGDLSYRATNRRTVCGILRCFVLVSGYLAFRLSWGFVKSVQELFCIWLDVSRASSLRGMRDNNKGAVRALINNILSVNMIE